MVTGPMIWLPVLVVRTLLGTVHGEHPGPVTCRCAGPTLPVSCQGLAKEVSSPAVRQVGLVEKVLSFRVMPEIKRLPAQCHIRRCYGAKASDRSK